MMEKKWAKGFFLNMKIVNCVNDVNVRTYVKEVNVDSTLRMNECEYIGYKSRPKIKWQI